MSLTVRARRFMESKMPTYSISEFKASLAGKLPDATWEDFQEIKKMWGRFPMPGEVEDSR